MAVFGNGNLKPWADGHCLFTRWPGSKWHLPLQNGQGSHTEIKTRTNHTIRKETSTGNCNSMKKDASGNVPHLFFLSVIRKIKLQGDITTEKSKRPLLISSDSVKSIQFVFYYAHLCMKCPLVSLIFLKRSLVFPIILFSSISMHWWLRKSFLSLLAILWNSAFKCVYVFFSPLLFASHLFTAICMASSDGYFAFLHFFSMGIVLIPVSCTMSRSSIHSSSGTLSDRVLDELWGWSWSLSPVQCQEPHSIVHQALYQI